MKALIRSLLAGGAALSLGSPAPSHAQTQYQQIVDPQIGCREWATYEKIMKYIARKDNEGYLLFTATAISAGECVIFELGQSVAIVDNGFFSVKLRPKGSLAGYWTVIEAIRPPR